MAVFVVDNDLQKIYNESQQKICSATGNMEGKVFAVSCMRAGMDRERA